MATELRVFTTWYDTYVSSQRAGGDVIYHEINNDAETPGGIEMLGSTQRADCLLLMTKCVAGKATVSL